MADVVIIGAGLTGLSAAYHLEKLGIDYVIFEHHERPGGLLRSVQEQGYTFDFTGHLLHINDDGFKAFIEEVAGLEQFSLVSRKTGIFSHNVITEYPFQMNLHGLPPSVIADCIEGYVLRKKNIKNPLTFHHWVLKHFGAGMAKHFFTPYNNKILAYDIRKVHPSWTGRFVPQTNLEAIIAGAIAPKTGAGVGYNSSFYYPRAGGIEFVISSIIKHLKTPILTNHSVAHIDSIAKRIYFTNGTSTRYKQLISTMPLKRLIDKTLQPHNPFEAVAKKLRCNAVINLNLGFNTIPAIDKHWLYFPEKDFPLYRLGFWHNVSPNSVPAGHAAVYAEFSYLPGTVSTTRLSRMTDEAISKTLAFLHLQRQHVTIEKILHLEHAYVIYDAWREQYLSHILDQLRRDSIHSIGRYGAWKYSSMQEAFIDGKQVAHDVNKALHHTQQHSQKGVQRGRGSSAVLP